jgi:hypothetical protein
MVRIKVVDTVDLATWHGVSRHIGLDGRGYLSIADLK